MTDVLIGGAGPTGMAAALFLAERGIEARIVEQSTTPSRHSKAFGVNPRTLELLEHTGVTEHLLAQGWQMHALNVWRDGHRVLRLDLAQTHHRYPFLLIHSQAKSEALLAQALSQRGLTIERGVDIEQVQASSNEAVVTVRHADQRLEIINTPLLLGADGARSTVRKTMGIGFPGSAYDEPWHLYDIALDVPLSPQEAHIFLLQDGAMFAVRLHDSVWRVLGNVQHLLERLPRGTQVGEVEWESDFGISHRLADQLQKGAVCLAGDAAHIHSGLGARGMNLGIEDAYVFAKLVHRGEIQRYGALRRPVIASVMQRVHSMTAVARGQAAWTKFVRMLVPLLSPIASVGASSMRTFILGLDHEVEIA